MAETHHTNQTIGETVTKHYKEWRLFVAMAEAKTDKALYWWQQTHWSALIGLGLLIAAMIVGDVLGIAGLF